MSRTEATACMHARLHARSTRMRTLPSITADAPASLAHGRFDGYAACSEANATRNPHNASQYKPSYAGRLIHADIGSPFIRTQHTGFQYLLVLVDDHTRFKAVHLLTNKTEAPGVRTFVVFPHRSMPS
eukprot:3921815-Pleurochrysis_carterae.AAC.5